MGNHRLFSVNKVLNLKEKLSKRYIEPAFIWSKADDSNKTGRLWIEHGNRPSKEENTQVETLQGDVNSNAGSETGDGSIEEGELYKVSSNTDVDSKAEREPSDAQNTDG